MSVDHTVGLGGDVLTECNRCELKLWHTVIAKADGLIRRVKCNTCKTEHSLRGEAKLPSHKRVAAKPALTKVVLVKERVPHKPWEEMIAGRDLGSAVPYSVTVTLEKNGLVQHPSFGVGIVTELSDDRKRAIVRFEAGEKVLAANR